MMYFGIFLVPLLFGIVSDSSWQTSFCNIALVSSLDILHCDELQDTLTFEAGNNITIELFNTTDKIKISANGGNQPNEKYCVVGVEWIYAFNETTSNFECLTVPTGATYENNTASNVGLGEGIFKQKTGVNLEFKGISVSGDLSISSNNSDITISYLDPVGGSGNMSSLNDGGDVTLTSPVVSSILYFVGGQWIDQIFKLDSVTTNCSGTDKVSGFAVDNQTGDHTITCTTDESGGGTAKEHFVADWELDVTKSNIGTSFVDIYTVTNANGDGIRIDTTGMTTVTLNIMWTKVGAGTQTCQIVDVASGANILITSGSLASGQNTLATQSIPVGLIDTIKTYKPQCKSTTSTDDPVWLHGTVLLQE